MSSYITVLELTQRQAQAVESGDLELAMSMLDARADALMQAGPAQPADTDTIREVLRLDRELSTAIRLRMIATREESVQLNASRTAVNSYRPPAGERRFRRVNVAG